METVSFPGLGLSFHFNNSISIGPFTITYYGIIIAVGMILAMVYAYKNFRKVGVDPDKATDAILGGIIGGIIGARLYYVIFSWKDFKDSPIDIFKIWEGGLAIYGGLLGALAIGVLIAKWRKVHISSLLDIAGIGFLLGQGMGRWGNFFNVEAFGDNTNLPWGMTGPKVVAYLTEHQSQLAAVGISVDPNMPVHPTFLYESLWCLAGFVLLALYLKHRKFDGEVFLMYLGYYGLERFLVEGLRTDSLMIGSLRVSQLLAGVLVIVSVVAILVIRSKIKNNHDETYRKLFVLTEEGQKILHNEKEKGEEKTDVKAGEETSVSVPENNMEKTGDEKEDTTNGTDY